MRIGITGHMNLTAATIELVRTALQRELERFDPADLTGVSCLAEGADAIFAQAVLDAGARLEAILPSRDYRDTQAGPSHRPVLDALTARAHRISYVAETSSVAAYAAANDAMLASVDRLLAVWDGLPSPKPGGTADAVATARALDIPVTVIWPEGAQRG
ncbi:hypothetical protein [Glycomyces algeriensis]|uniref:Uncharacterized protein n=1 Tax=Glycomyces algeriensis TaxID=256037 RepID=A0A9W6G8J1_9ACTN|nr:hypothetical protein [Glycomyces algeriensis]MDA1367982.1 hypothetical protein [Glycomyces algeriensis]MDR7349521.1 hypothetical protein [Glycomyces algeriensis]GLI42228.1 hypothetical protein GALLR39Z86_20780 [Glycomyces algeriensis]